MIGGYAGKMLFVDLTRGELVERSLSEDLARSFLGGYGIGAKVLYEMMQPGVDPWARTMLSAFSRTGYGYKGPLLRPLYHCPQIANKRGLDRRQFRRLFWPGIEKGRL